MCAGRLGILEQTRCGAKDSIAPVSIIQYYIHNIIYTLIMLAPTAMAGAAGKRRQMLNVSEKEHP